MEIKIGYRWLIPLVVVSFQHVYCTMPSGCSYDDTDSVGLYTCDKTSISLPLAFSGFSPSSQRLKIDKINGNLPASGTFSGYSSYTSGSFDTNFPASLELKCSTSATTSLTISANTFSGMGYLQTFKITNCYTASFPANVFSDLGELDSFTITGGIVDGMTVDSFTSVDIKTLAVPDSKAQFEMSNLVLTGGTLPANLLSGFTNVRRIVLDNIGLTTVSASDFSSNTQLLYLSLRYNSFTNIPSALFTGLDGLASFEVTGINWDCSCDNLWFLDYCTTNDIEIQGAICNTPTTYTEKKTQTYYQDTCVTTDVCNGNPGIAMGTYCMMVWDVAAYCVLLVTLIVSLVALGLVVGTRKELVTGRFKLDQKKTSAWDIVLEALRRRDGAGMKPPAAVTSPNQTKGWI